MSIRKKVKVSKNRKKSWRKHTDITEVEDFLENQNFEERIGLSITEAKNDELFIIEKAGDDTVYEQKLEQIQSKFSTANVNESKLRKIASSYKLYDKLEPISKVPAIRGRDPNKERRKTIYNDDTKLIKFWEDKKKFIEQGQAKKNERKLIQNDPKLRFDCYNIWDQDNGDNSEENEYVKKKPAVKVPEHLRQKPSLLPAIEVPVGGQSYNPDKEDHTKLFIDETNKELKKINKEKYWANKVENFYLTKEQAAKAPSWAEEMSQGLGLYDHENEEDEDSDGDQETEDILKAVNFGRPENKKTKAVRRRELREKLTKKQKEADKKLKVKENAVFRIRTFKKELKERDERIKRRAGIRARKHIESLYKPKRLSKHNFTESETALNLPSELPGSLRTVKVEGNLLEDRFKSLQKRNLIETRVPQNPKRKFKLKKEVKRRHHTATI